MIRKREYTWHDFYRRVIRLADGSEVMIDRESAESIARTCNAINALLED